MKQKQVTKVEKMAKVAKVEKDYGKDLLDTIIFLIMLLVVLWYFKV